MWMLGKHNKAHDSWNHALSVAHFNSNSYEQGLAYFELGRHAVGEKRKKNLQAAWKLFEKLESSFDVDRLKSEQVF